MPSPSSSDGSDRPRGYAHNERDWDDVLDDAWTVVSISEQAAHRIEKSLEAYAPNETLRYLRMVIRRWAEDHCQKEFSVIGWQVIMVNNREKAGTLVYQVAFEDADDAMAYKMRWG